MTRIVRLGPAPLDPNAPDPRAVRRFVRTGAATGAIYRMLLGSLSLDVGGVVGYGIYFGILGAALGLGTALKRHLPFRGRGSRVGATVLRSLGYHLTLGYGFSLVYSVLGTLGVLPLEGLTVVGLIVGPPFLLPPAALLGLILGLMEQVPRAE